MPRVRRLVISVLIPVIIIGILVQGLADSLYAPLNISNLNLDLGLDGIGEFFTIMGAVLTVARPFIEVAEGFSRSESAHTKRATDNTARTAYKDPGEDSSLNRLPSTLDESKLRAAHDDLPVSPSPSERTQFQENATAYHGIPRDRIAAEEYTPLARHDTNSESRDQPPDSTAMKPRNVAHRSSYF